ncbi:MAG TPA: nuclear transport factor 2 family protein [Gemmatimonadales bacterium]|jgi:uncharacterized protein (TIGR02246 family)
MRTPIASALGLLALALATGCTQTKSAAMTSDSTVSAAPKVDKQAEENTIREIGRKWEKMFADKDSSGIGQLFADDGYEMPPGTKAMKGPDEVTKGVGAMLRNSKDFKLSFAPTTITVSDAGDMAAERGTYQASWTGSKGKKIEDHGNYVTVWKKVGGQWKVLSDINASDVPGAM